MKGTIPASAATGTHAITAEMVATTAAELDQDLGAYRPVAAPDAAEPAETPATDALLVQRLEALEATVARQERNFRRILDMLAQRDGARA